MYTTESGKTDSSVDRSLKLWISKRVGNIQFRALAICFAIGLSVLSIEVFRLPIISDFLDTQELAVHDRFFTLRDLLDPDAQRQADEIVLIGADADSARRLNVSDKDSISRETYAKLIKQLQSAGARIIGLDLPLDGSSGLTDKAHQANAPSGAKLSQDDQALADALQSAKNIVLASNVDAEARQRLNGYRLPYTPFVEALGLESGSVGNALITPDRDGLVRHMPLALEQFSPSAFLHKTFSLRIAEKELDNKAFADAPGKLFLRKHIYPTTIRLNFVGPPRTFKMAPLWRALDWKTHIAHNGLFYPSTERSVNNDGTSNASGNGPDQSAVNPFQNKIVLVGLVDNAAEGKAPVSGETSELSQQLLQSFDTPVSPRAMPMSAVELQANALSNILHDRFLDEPEPWKCAFLCLILALVLGKSLGQFHIRPWMSLVAVAIFSLVWVVGAYCAFASLNMLVPVVVPLLGVALPCWGLVVLDAESFVRRERRRRTRVFRSLAAKPLAQEIERKLLAELGLEGKRMTVTVIACQLREFTGKSEDESPEAIMQRLNACLSIIMDCIGEHHGLVERIWNCGVIGIWGAPIAMAEDKQAKLATDCALAIRKRLFNQHDSKDLHSGLNFNFTCGISTGDSVCGTINAIARDTNLTQYGAIGPAVDLAIELESLNPTYGTSFTLSSSTAALVSQMFEVREIDRVKLSHRDTNQSVFELLPWEGSLPGALEEAMALFKQGRVSFEEGRVQEAEQLFSTSLRMVPHDKPTMIMLDRCRELIGKTSAGQGQEFVQKMTLKERLSEGRE